jgi:F-type H+-transporting ATPase subunit delta
MYNYKSWATAFINSVEKAGDDSSARDITTHFFQLLIKKKRIRHVNSVIAEIKNILDKKRGIVTVFAEYASPLEEEFESILCEIIKKRIGASGVNLIGKVNPDLIGGYRLRIGDEIIDTSIRGHLRNMEAWLAGVDGEN